MLSYNYYAKRIELLAHARELDDGSDDFIEFASGQLLEELRDAYDHGFINANQETKLLMKYKMLME